MTEQPEPRAPDTEYHREKAYAVSQRSYRRFYGRGALRMLETAYAEDVGKLCDRVEQLEKASKALLGGRMAGAGTLENTTKPVAFCGACKLWVTSDLETALSGEAPEEDPR